MEANPTASRPSGSAAGECSLDELERRVAVRRSRVRSSGYQAPPRGRLRLFRRFAALSDRLRRPPGLTRRAARTVVRARKK